MNPIQNFAQIIQKEAEKRVDFSQLSPEQKQQIINSLTEVILERITLVLLSKLNQQQYSELEQILNSADQNAVASKLMELIPDAAEVAKQVISDSVQEYANNLAQAGAQPQQQPQQMQATPAPSQQAPQIPQAQPQMQASSAMASAQTQTETQHQQQPMQGQVQFETQPDLSQQQTPQLSYNQQNQQSQAAQAQSIKQEDQGINVSFENQSIQSDTSYNQQQLANQVQNQLEQELQNQSNTDSSRHRFSFSDYFASFLGKKNTDNTQQTKQQAQPSTSEENFVVGEDGQAKPAN